MSVALVALPDRYPRKRVRDNYEAIVEYGEGHALLSASKLFELPFFQQLVVDPV